MVEKVILAVNGGTASDAAADWVAERSQGVRLGVEITTVVGSRIAGGQDGDDYVQTLSRADSRLRATAPGLSTDMVARHGNVSRALIALSRQADLLVIGAQPVRAFPANVEGTLIHALARHAGCVTVVVPAGWQRHGNGVVAAWKDDDCADRVLDFAADEADRLGERLRVLHVWEIPPVVDGPHTAMMMGDDTELYRQLLTTAKERLRAAHPQLDVDCEVEGGVIAPTVIHAAANARLLVIGAPPHGALAGFLTGSVGAEILRARPCPVAIIPRLPATTPDPSRSRH